MAELGTKASPHTKLKIRINIIPHNLTNISKLNYSCSALSEIEIGLTKEYSPALAMKNDPHMIRLKANKNVFALCKGGLA